jgi:hypothetical protein
MSKVLLDAIKREFKLKNDAALAVFLGDTRPSISVIRNGKKKVPAALILKIHKATKWPVSAIDALIKAE